MTTTARPTSWPWRLAIAGCGAAAFGLHLPLLARSTAFELIAVTDRDPERARAAQRRFAVPRTASRVGDLLQDVDALVILTGVHEDLIEEALDAGVHVVTEKPVCLDVVRTRKLAERAREAGLLLEVGAMRAHDPALHAALAHVPKPAGGWLVKADGVDESARRHLLPSGFAPYTFDQDPTQPVPDHLVPHQVTALQILLWQGYHLLTALVLAVPAPPPRRAPSTRPGSPCTPCCTGRTGSRSRWSSPRLRPGSSARRSTSPTRTAPPRSTSPAPTHRPTAPS
ncbi:Gfo/Idh/MocA family protein [Streptomyces cupreus]|uniref:Gfo/Idh/MocA family oxidoreductase n=1 Tax=Streptomyces cupreus TaxID=2759956 RepID=A0A7X1J9R6_9ACTN|nr:Gfo/Idh/MocA family oxidoreductase [Streptomyces cupreus]MBC2906751.1 Gfo/Idh/MocA family oxidoreductase [Streptomyces cupreus]